MTVRAAPKPTTCTTVATSTQTGDTKVTARMGVCEGRKALPAKSTTSYLYRRDVDCLIVGLAAKVFCWPAGPDRNRKGILYQQGSVDRVAATSKKIGILRQSGWGCRADPSRGPSPRSFAEVRDPYPRAPAAELARAPPYVDKCVAFSHQQLLHGILWFDS